MFLRQEQINQRPCSLARFTGPIFANYPDDFLDELSIVGRKTTQEPQNNCVSMSHFNTGFTTLGLRPIPPALLYYCTIRTSKNTNYWTIISYTCV